MLSIKKLILQYFLADNSDNNDWEKYLGNKDDPTSSIMIRFPNGNRITKEIPCSSQFLVSNISVMKNYINIIYTNFLFFFSGYYKICSVRRISPRFSWNCNKLSQKNLNRHGHFPNIKGHGVVSQGNGYCSTKINPLFKNSTNIIS